MKEYINRLARGKFTYQRPELEVQDYTLTGSVTAGGQGMFTFRFTASQPAYGIVLSSHARVRIEKPQFGTTPAEIVYTVDAADLKEGTVIQGQFYIVSSAGEKSVSYEYTVEAQKVMRYPPVQELGKRISLGRPHLYQYSVRRSKFF